MLSHSLKMHKMEVKSPLALEDQQRFWRRMHHHFLHQETLRENRKNMVWVDVIYRPNEPWEVYFSAPAEITPNLAKWFRKDRKRVNKVDVDIQLIDPEILSIPNGLSVCELKLAFDNLFALPLDTPSLLPEKLPLNEGEAAIVSFCFIPIPAVKWNLHKSNLLHSKMEQGIRKGRGRVEAVGWLGLLLYYLGQWIGRFLPDKFPSAPEDIGLSKGTLRKLNDCHFQSYIRIAAPQRVIPKLARVFQGEGAENHLLVTFMPRKEGKTALTEISEKKLHFLTRNDLNPNILGSREIASLLSFFPCTRKVNQELASPNLK